ncbi:MAG: hypothetical protein PHI31_17825 [Desulfuromonadaceae bacterium]|nr:hypothetical protein [Desulfuromonadaceae bacterium]
MKFARAYNCLITFVLIVAYLAVPATGLARAATLDSASVVVLGSGDATTSAPCDTCPCSDEQGDTCCDTTFCSCAYHAPLNCHLHLTYAPIVATQHFQEPSWSLPQVYSSIFVPPQNFV